MGVNNTGSATCDFCGAEYHLFTIFNRDMQGLCKAWRRRHERACRDRTPAERRKWARPYIRRDRSESSLIVDLLHPGFRDIQTSSPSATPGEPPTRRRPRITARHAAGNDHQVVTIEGGTGAYRRKPCSDCPWRTDAVGAFPAEAFRHSACTAYDMAQSTFACHQSGAKAPATCAGFLLRGADHNLSVRLGRRTGRIQDDVSDGGHDLHASYKAMAVANGVAEDDPVLQQCREPY